MALVMLLVFVVVGAGTGYAIHRLVGCRSGACPIWASPRVATLYGAVLGLVLGLGR